MSAYRSSLREAIPLGDPLKRLPMFAAVILATVWMLVAAAPAFAQGEAASITIVALTNSYDANLPPGPLISAGDPVNWTYEVTNTGDVSLSNVAVNDSQGVTVSCPQDALALDESMTCTADGTAQAGQYGNVGSVVGTPPDEPDVSDDDPSHYFGASPASSLRSSRTVKTQTRRSDH